MSNTPEQIKARLNLAEIIGEYLPLKQSGRSLKGLCPFHQEKTPSLIVSPERNSWHCFGCNEGGDVFTFIQKIEGLDFPAALKLLAERAGVPLPAHAPAPAAKNQRQRLFDLLAAAARFYHQLLGQSTVGAKARHYLTQRGVTPATAELFQLGYAPRSWDALQRWLASAGFTPEEMVAAGLVGRSQSGKYFDRFRGRIIFPITDVQGRVIAFGGRIVPWHDSGGEGKYINSPETSLYAKRQTIYNLARAKAALRGGQPCLVVEGYMDVVMLVQHGLANVVASSGTAFTSEHIALLARFTDTLHFAFDADKAGLKAAVAATAAALRAGLQVATVLFPGGKDPAEVALTQPDKLARAVAQPQPLIKVLLKQLAASPQRQPLESLLPLLATVANPIQQGAMIQQLAATLHVPEETVIGLVARQRASHLGPADSTNQPPPAALGASLPERQLLGILLLDPPARQRVFPRLQTEELLDPALQALYNSLHTIAQAHAPFLSMSADNIISLLPASQHAQGEAVRASGEEALRLSSNPPVQEAESLWAALRRRLLQQRLAQLQEQLASGQTGQRRATIEQFQEVAGQLAQL